jgi:tagatose-1,6-bisphosphate aldolase non-catalytic subunit AgaZ/GatZ
MMRRMHVTLPPEQGIEALMREAEDSGGYTEMTAQDWEDIEREGLAIVNSRKHPKASMMMAADERG